MKNNSRDVTFKGLIITGFSVLSAFSCLLPILGPSFIAYAIGVSRRHRHKFWDISNANLLISMAIGQIAITLATLPVTRACIIVDRSQTFWYLLFIWLVINYSLAVTFYFIGNYRAKIKQLKTG